MRIDLFSSNATALTIKSEFYAPLDLISNWKNAGLEAVEQNAPMKMLAAMGGYTLKGKQHHIALTLLGEDEEDGSYDELLWSMELEYEILKEEDGTVAPMPREITRQTRKIREFLDSQVFKNITPPSTLHSVAYYDYDLDTIEPIIALPIRHDGGEELPFTEIVGVRAIKRFGPFVEYTVTIDMKSDTHFALAVIFQSDRSITSKTPAYILKRSNALEEMFTIKA